MLRAVVNMELSILMFGSLAGLSDNLAMLIDNTDVVVEKRAQLAAESCHHVRGSWWWG